jgi:hypothetical protein
MHHTQANKNKTTPKHTAMKKEKNPSKDMHEGDNLLFSNEFMIFFLNSVYIHIIEQILKYIS